MMDIYLPPHPRGEKADKLAIASADIPNELWDAVEVIVDAMLKRTDPHLDRDRYVDEINHLLILAYRAGFEDSVE